MEILTVENVTTAAAVTYLEDKGELRINAAHPAAQELRGIAEELKNCVEYLNDDDDKGMKLLDRAGTLAGMESSYAIQFAWSDFKRAEWEAKAQRQAQDWFKKWKKTYDPDTAEYAQVYDEDFAYALLGAGGCRALFAYAYTEGGKTHEQ